MNTAKFWCLLALIGTPLGFCESLKDVRVEIPPAIKKGERAVLVCHYDLEDDSLYSIKWYKGRREFYRYTPKEEPKIKIFPILHLNVLLNGCNATQVTLNSVDLSVSGRYSCEVSADAPSFHTALVSGDMDIVEIPTGVPQIDGLKQRYKIGDLLFGNCSSTYSKPAANLTWVINGEQAPSHQIIFYRTTKEPTVGSSREYSTIGLRLPITSSLFTTGRLKIRCSASIHTLYWKVTEKSVEEEKPRDAKTNGVHFMHPVTEQPASGFKYGNDEIQEQEEETKSISGGCGSRGSRGTSLVLLVVNLVSYFASS